MHAALLIDEIIRQIFYFCSENERSSLAAAARSCTSWKEPALDLIWDRLPSFGPLLALLPIVSEVDSQNVHDLACTKAFEKYHSYARRVKHISQRNDVKIPLTVVSRISALSYAASALPNLRTAHISIPRSNALLMPLNLSASLRHLDVDLGFKPVTSVADFTLCNYLARANVHSPELKHVSLRGLASERLNYVLASMCNLEILSLRLGRSLLPGTLSSIMASPHLKEFEAHAGHLQPDDIDLSQNDTPTFPSLEKLHIRAKSSFIEEVLNHIEPNTLQHLHLEIDDDTSAMTSWNTIFSSIYDKASNSLHHLSLEHHFELPEIPSSTSSDATTTQSPQTPPNPSHRLSSLNFDTMKPLRDLRHLRHFSCDVTLPPNLRDQDMEKLACWWPRLEYLELGSVPQTAEGDEQPDVAYSHLMTIASLDFIAAKCAELQQLTLPLVVDDAPLSALPSGSSASKLRNLTIAQLNTSTPVEFAGYLRCMFPHLQHLDGPCDDTQAWVDARQALRL